jgi:hypothetical protein
VTAALTEIVEQVLGELKERDRQIVRMHLQGSEIAEIRPRSNVVRTRSATFSIAFVDAWSASVTSRTLDWATIIPAAKG